MIRRFDVGGEGFLPIFLPAAAVLRDGGGCFLCRLSIGIMIMKILARCVLAQCALLCATLAHSSTPDAVAISTCRAKHAEQPLAHVACLERELRVRSDIPKEGAVAPPSLGAEQVRASRSQESIEQVTVEIESATYSFDGLGLYRMTDGQIWRASESTSREQRLEPGKRYTARIERGRIGGYRMHVEGVRRMIKVRRVE